MRSNQYILMLEDDGDDQYITETYFASHSDIALKFYTDPEELLAYLYHCYETGCVLPSLILLDRRVPTGSGTEVLGIIKSHPELKQIPVVMVSGSDLPADIAECYRLGANSYIVKPFSHELTAKKISTFITYWFEVAELPQMMQTFTRVM